MGVAQHSNRTASADRNYRLCRLCRQHLNHKYKPLALNGVGYKGEEFRQEQARCIG